MVTKKLIRQLNATIESRDTAAARDILTRHVAELKKDEWLNSFLRDAAGNDDVAMVSLLVEFGADIHAPDGYGDPPAPEGVIDIAANNGAINVIQWLLDHGARVNYQVEGVTRSLPLAGAVIDGHLDVVRLLVEKGGADINATWAGHNALSFAIMYSHKEIEAYLRSQGAKEPWQLEGYQPPVTTDPILRHVEKHLGTPHPLSLHEIVPNDPPVTIHVVPMEDRLALVTSGMSSQPMTVPAEGEGFQYAELVMYLPPDWPLLDKALQDPNFFWPLEWLRRIARYPHENDTWLGGSAAVFANEEPPEPLAPNTKMTCLLALTEDSEFGCLDLSDGRRVVFYTLVPLYTEERDLEKAKGTERLLRLFEKHGISNVVDVRRPNVARASGRRGRGRGSGRA